MTNPARSTLFYMGRALEELSREELIEALENSHEEILEARKGFIKAYMPTSPSFSSLPSDVKHWLRYEDSERSRGKCK